MSVSVRVLPVATYPANTYTVPSTAIDDAVTKVEVSVQRCTSADPTIWPSATAEIRFNFECSTDNGATWFPWIVNAGGFGGIKVGRNGEVLTTYIVQAFPPGTGRRVRGTILLTESIKTAADITVT